MLVQPRADAVRLVRQHDHALASGILAGAWRGPGGEAPLPPTLVVACALHDGMWRIPDALPSLDPRSGLPLDFVRFPADRKRAFTASWLEALGAVEPGVERLVRLHHATLGSDVAPPRDLAWLRLFDRLSLHVALTPPGSLEAHRPPWLGSPVPTPEGEALAMAWDGPSLLRVDPWPFAGDRVALDLPVVDLPGTRWTSEAALHDAWNDAPGGTWSLALRPHRR